MNISPVNNISFEKLYISRDKKTQKIMKDILLQETYQRYLQKTFEDFYSETGDVDVVLSAKENKKRGEYTLYANKKDKAWRGVSVTYPRMGAHIESIRNLCKMCVSKISSMDEKTKAENRADKLIADYTEKKHKRAPMADPLDLLDIGVWPWS